MKHNNVEVNKKRGKRLQACRRELGMTQEQLAEKLNVTKNCISYYERGERTIHWETATAIGKILDINPAYIMCISDMPIAGHNDQPSDNSNDNKEDLCLLNLIQSMGYSIKFRVMRLKGKEPDIVERVSYMDHKIYSKDWKRLEEIVTIDRLENFSFSNYHCYLINGEIKSEVVVTEVIFNEERYSFGLFRFIKNRIMDYFRFTLTNLNNNLQEKIELGEEDDSMWIEIAETNRNPMDDVKEKAEDIRTEKELEEYRKAIESQQ